MVQFRVTAVTDSIIVLHTTVSIAFEKTEWSDKSVMTRVVRQEWSDKSGPTRVVSSAYSIALNLLLARSSLMLARISFI